MPEERKIPEGWRKVMLKRGSAQLSAAMICSPLACRWAEDRLRLRFERELVLESGESLEVVVR
ncbi:MAG: hypothetical protein R6X33_00985 [Candidatus Brocadiia bacterium]